MSLTSSLEESKLNLEEIIDVNMLFNMDEFFNREWDELAAKEDNGKVVFITKEKGELP